MRPSPFALVQLACAGVVLARLGRGRTRRAPLALGGSPSPPDGAISVVVPARDEAARIGPCLAPLIDDPSVDEVVVVDDGSSDATAAVAAAAGARVVAGAPLPDGWVGKPWALQQGLEAARGDWVVTLDADARPARGLAGALVARLREDELDVLTAGPRFDCRTPGERFLHPAMLASLVLRFGPSDAVGRQPRAERVVGNGQCLAVSRERLLQAGGFARASANMTDDIALLRSLARDGWRVGFVDGADLLDVRMHEDGREVWREWGRSLAMTDVTPPPWLALDLLVTWVAQAAPLPRLLARRGNGLDVLLVVLRLALLPALARSYERRGVPFWLSPLTDVGVAVRLTLAVARPTRTWRGRSYG